MNLLKRMSIALICMMIAVSVLAEIRLGFPGEESASVGIYIKDLRTGNIIAQNEASKALVPASIQKAITTATALTILGPTFTFKTPVFLYGTKKESTWEGNLVIESCGDPTIDSGLFKNRAPLYRTIINGLKNEGISEITGKIIIYEPLLNPGQNPCWEIEDTPWAYGAGLYGFNFMDNSYKLWPATGKTEPFIPDLHLTVIKSQNNDLWQGVNSNDLIVYGKDVKNLKWRVTPAMNNPALVFQYLLKDKLEEAGIKILGKETNDENSQLLVCEYTSPIITEILKQLMHESHNLFAEGMLRAIAPGESRMSALKKEITKLQELGIKTNYNKISDGSGLARDNRSQPQFISAVLEAMAKGEYATLYLSTFPKVGLEGTVKNLLAKTSLKGKLALKSGSMGGIQCFAGYKLDAQEKPTHTVIIMINSFYCQRSELRGCIEKFLLDTFKD